MLFVYYDVLLNRWVMNCIIKHRIRSSFESIVYFVFYQNLKIDHIHVQQLCTHVRTFRLFTFVSGALFDVNAEEDKRMFAYAIERVNENLLNADEFRLEAELGEIEYGNEVTVSRGVCELLEVRQYFTYMIFQMTSFYSVEI